MRIVIDMQGAQSSFSGSRGVGRYAKNLVKQLIICFPEAEFFLALNGKLPCSEIFDLFKDVLPRENIKTWTYYPHVPFGKTEDQNGLLPEELFREWFLHQFHADIIWIPNLQEGENEAEIATSAKLTRGSETVITTLHDVTPLLFEKEYLSFDNRDWYMKKLQYACDSDIILTVSDFSKKKIVELLNVDENRVKVVKNGYDDHCFYPDTNYLSNQSKEKFFLYCGGADKHKNLRRLIEAFLNLNNHEYRLVLAGKEVLRVKDLLLEGLEDEECVDNIEFPGFVKDDDLLRMMQRCRGFVFAAYAEGFGLPPLEAMACGAPTVVADATSLKEVVADEEARFDPYSVEEIEKVLKKLVNDGDFVDKIIQSGLQRAKVFSWKRSAEELKQIMIESQDNKAELGIPYSKIDLCQDLKELLERKSRNLRFLTAKSIEESTLFNERTHIYIDASAVINEDYVSGIQRVVNGYASGIEDIFNDSNKVDVQVVYSRPGIDQFYVCEKFNDHYKYSKDETAEQIVEFYDGDVLLMPDLHPSNVISKHEYLKSLVKRGIKVFTVIYDLIPMEFPQFFSEDFVKEYTEYLHSISDFSGVVAISKATLDAYVSWCKANDIKFSAYYKPEYCHIGADFGKANPTKGLPENAVEVLNKINSVPSALMVSTIEPRKMHIQVLDAFELLWKKNENVNLVFVGRAGWKMDEFIERIKNHPMLNKHLFWLSGISDEYLEKVYKSSTGIIVASLQEGYGLPIIEAAQYKKPLLLRDIPVFKEVAGDNSEYFVGTDADGLSETILKWFKDIKEGRAAKSENIKFNTWKDSSMQLMKIVQPSLLTSNGQESNASSYKCESIRDRESIKKQQGQYVKYFAGCKNVLNIGSGRGEFLELLRENGILAKGVDTKEELVYQCRCFGFDADCSDVVEYLKTQKNLDGIFCSQEIQKLPFDKIVRLCEEAYYRMQFGAKIVIQATGSTNSDIFYLDPTYDKPVHPGSMKHLLESIGFKEVEIVFPEGSSSDHQIPHMISDSVNNLQQINEAVDFVNDAFFKNKDYIIVGKK